MSNNELIIIPKIEKYTKFKIYQPKERIINELDQYSKTYKGLISVDIKLMKEE